jgi:hypothetical protein
MRRIAAAYSATLALLLTVVRAEAAEATNLVLESFEGPFDWTGGNKINAKIADYFVVSDGKKNHVLHSKFIAETDGAMIYRKVEWDTEKFPVLTWRWRVLKFPTGAKVQDEEKSDAAAQIYVAWRNRGRIYGLKYFWTESDPNGTTFISGKYNPVGTYQGIFIRMGGKLGEWQTEKRNVRDDYKKAFGNDAPQMINGIGILTDGDQTKTLPEAEFDDFIAVKK